MSDSYKWTMRRGHQPAQGRGRVRIVDRRRCIRYWIWPSDKEGYPYVAVGRDPAEIAAESFPSEVALLDATGTITWANAAWLRAARAGSGLLAGSVLGVDAIRAFRASSVGVASGVAAVVGGERVEFEQEIGSDDDARRWRLHANALRGPSRGAVLVRTEITGAARRAPWDLQDPEDLAARIGRLTSRERDVLRLMVRGRNNREIATELGVAYTTVRSHVRSVIEKLGARSRLDAVARVTRGDLGGIAIAP